MDDNLNTLLQLAIKYESIQILIHPNIDHQGYKLWNNPEKDKQNKLCTIEQTRRGPFYNNQTRRPAAKNNSFRGSFRNNDRVFTRYQRRPETRYYAQSNGTRGTRYSGTPRRGYTNYNGTARRDFKSQSGNKEQATFRDSNQKNSSFKPRYNNRYYYNPIEQNRKYNQKTSTYNNDKRKTNYFANKSNISNIEERETSLNEDNK